MLRRFLVRGSREHLRNTSRRRWLSSEAGVEAPKAIRSPNISPPIPRAERHALRSGKGPSNDTASASARSQEHSIAAKASYGVLITGTAGVVAWLAMDDEKKKQVTTALKNSPLGDLYEWFGAQVAQVAKPFTDPSRDKLLPDWPLPGMPENTPCPPTLVIGLEDTLVHSEWDRKHGWRHAKRPGVDKFLETLCRYYEIVIFSNQLHAVGDEIVTLLDKNMYAMHRLYRDSTRFIDGKHVKDISGINRDLKRVVAVDDDAAFYVLQPGNFIPVKPFSDGRNRGDHELADLLPFLVALASERVDDFPSKLNEFRDSDGELRDLTSKYKARLHAMKMQQEEKRSSGLGGLLRKSALPTNTGSAALRGKFD